MKKKTEAGCTVELHFMGLLRDEIFAKVAAVNSLKEYEQIDPADTCEDYGLYYASESDEVPSGVYIASTPVDRRTNIGVIKLFGQRQLPFKVEGQEPLPSGNGFEEDSVELGCFNTLGEAFSFALCMYRKGYFSVVDGEISTPMHTVVDANFASRVNSLLEQRSSLLGIEERDVLCT